MKTWNGLPLPVPPRVSRTNPTTSPSRRSNRPPCQQRARPLRSSPRYRRLRSAIFQDKFKVSGIVHALTGDVIDGIAVPQFSEYYRTLRYQDTVEGPLARIEADDATLARLMGL